MNKQSSARSALADCPTPTQSGPNYPSQCNCIKIGRILLPTTHPEPLRYFPDLEVLEIAGDLRVLLHISFRDIGQSHWITGFLDTENILSR